MDEIFKLIADEKEYSAIEYVKRNSYCTHTKNNGMYPLALAIQKGYTGLAECLLKEGANVAQYNGNEGLTALHIAAELGRENAVKLLLKYGADVNHITHRPWFTPLHKAASKGHTKIVKMLIKHGANPNERISGGETALDLAKKNDHIGTVRLLNTVMGRGNDDSLSSWMVRNLMKSTISAAGGAAGGLAAGSLVPTIGTAIAATGLTLTSAVTLPVLGILTVGGAIVTGGSYIGSQLTTKIYKDTTYDSDDEKEENWVESIVHTGVGAYAGKKVTDKVFGKATDYGMDYTTKIAKEKLARGTINNLATNATNAITREALRSATSSGCRIM